MLEVRFDPSQPSISAVPGPLPTLRVKLVIRVIRDAAGAGAVGQSHREFLMGMEPRLSLNGVPLPQVRVENGPRFGDVAHNIVHHEATWTAAIPTEVLRVIEDVRKDDVQVDFSCQMNFWSTAPDGVPGPLSSAYPSYQTKLSQKEWDGILRQMGYQGAWILEIPLPIIDGLKKTSEFLESARQKVQDRDAVGAVTDCRKAWDAADRILDAHPEARDKEIDGLSLEEEKQPPKSKRIRDAREAIDKFCQIGPHSDIYQVTMDDALLAYRVTASLLAYLSKKVQESQKRTKI